MGWGSAGEIFNPLAAAVVAKVSAGNVDHDQATDILATLILKLQDGDWDTENESLEAFDDWPFVVAAFERCGVYKRYDVDSEKGIESLVKDVLRSFDDKATVDELARAVASRLKIALDEA